MISIYNSVESPIKDIEILGNTVDGVSVGILQDDGQYKITLFTNNGLDNMSPDFKEDKEELLLPCQLEKQGDSTDRLYYDKEEKAWCIYKVGQSKIVLPVTFTISLNSFYGTTNLYMVSGEVEGTIKAKVSKSLGASVSSLNDKADVLIDKIDAMLGGKVDLDGYATIEYVDVKDGEIKGVLDNMFEEYTEEQISVDFPNASTISIVDNDDLFTSTTIEGALRELASNSSSGIGEAIEQNKNDISDIKNELSKTENTKYSTENGVKEFECKNGYVDNIVIEGQTKILNAENIEVEAGTDGAKLVSVGQGDKIEVLTRSESNKNLFYGGVELGYINSSTGEEGSSVNGVRSIEYIKVKPNTTYTVSNDKGYNVSVNGYNIDKSKYLREVYGKTPFTFTTNNETHWLRIRTFASNKENDLTIKWQLEEGVSATEYVPPKYNKKQISTTLRSLPNGVKDTIEKRGNKYYKIKRCGEYTINENSKLREWSSQAGATTKLYGLNEADNVISDAKPLSGARAGTIFCNQYKSLNTIWDAIDANIGAVIDQNKVFSFRDLSSKFPTLDSVYTYLKSNPITVVYELETPIIEELPNFNPQTFSDKTTLLLNSGVVQGEASFEVTNSLGSELEVLKDKVSDLDDNVVNEEVYYPTLLNGFSQVHFNDNNFIKKIGNMCFMNLVFRNTSNVQDGTLICKLPLNFKSKNVTRVVSIGDTLNANIDINENNILIYPSSKNISNVPFRVNCCWEVD